MKEEEQKLDGNLPEVADPLLELVKNTFLNEFFPTQKFEEGCTLMSTNEIYIRFQSVCPSPCYSETDISNFLFQKGFRFVNTEILEYKWILLPNNSLND